MIVKQLPDETQLNEMPLVLPGQGRTQRDINYSILITAIVTMPVWIIPAVAYIVGWFGYEIYRGIYEDFRRWRRRRIPTGIE